MQLVCRYDGDGLGVIVCDYPDGSAVGGDAVPSGCVLIRGQGAVDSRDPLTGDEVYPKVGPEPAKLGDEPTDTHPDHDELDDNGVPLTVRVTDASGAVRERTHPMRAAAGQPYKDRRRVAENDARPRRAPPQGDPAVLQAYASWLAEASAARGVVVGGVRYPADPAGLHTAEARAARSLRDPKFSVKVQDEAGQVRPLSGQNLVDVADAVSDRAAALADVLADLSAKISAGQVRRLADVDALVEA